jgi:hypothetical protein
MWMNPLLEWNGRLGHVTIETALQSNTKNDAAC